MEGTLNAPDVLWAAMEAESLLLRADKTEEAGVLGDAIMEYQRAHAADMRSGAAAPMLAPVVVA
jgi:hypothetical protein